jgi:hypothetical protein
MIIEINDYALTPRQAINLAYEWVNDGFDDVAIDLTDIENIE